MSAAGRWRRLLARARSLSVGRLLGATIGLLLVLGVLGIGLALVANGQLDGKRTLLLDEIEPSLRASLKLESALVDEETGVRGYIITGEPGFLAPYRSGLREERAAIAALRSHEHAIGTAAAGAVEAVRSRSLSWRRRFVTPALEGRGGGVRGAGEAKRLFDSIRGGLEDLEGSLSQEDHRVRGQLDHAASSLQALLILATALIVGGIVCAGFILRWTISRPLGRLGAEAQRIAAGEFDTPFDVADGPLEVAFVGAEMDAMRQMIVAELEAMQSAHAQLERQTLELQRSNAELEQFAYVASHDLQEPLRKVASFCQALQKRYADQLDERAEQYIAFAVDGAKRMQALINDLLELSRVGRGDRELEPLPLTKPLAAAQAAVAARIEESGARIEAVRLPTVLGDRTLLTSLFQNLIGNAVKFRGEQAPRITIAAEPVAGMWELSFADNGLGIDPEYAERIFLIFQRLHSRETYEGSGIGLALCRKIIEHHGGRMWLDTSYRRGACFRFTLPGAPQATADASPTIATEAR